MDFSKRVYYIVEKVNYNTLGGNGDIIVRLKQAFPKIKPHCGQYWCNNNMFSYMVSVPFYQNDQFRMFLEENNIDHYRLYSDPARLAYYCFRCNDACKQEAAA